MKKHDANKVTVAVELRILKTTYELLARRGRHYFKDMSVQQVIREIINKELEEDMKEVRNETSGE